MIRKTFHWLNCSLTVSFFYVLSDESTIKDAAGGCWLIDYLMANYVYIFLEKKLNAGVICGKIRPVYTIKIQIATDFMMFSLRLEAVLLT